MWENIKLGRRALLTGAAAALASPALAQSDPSDPEVWRAQVQRLEPALGGRIGISAHDTESGRTFGYRDDERFAMCSTFKLLLACAMLQRVQFGDELDGLDAQLRFGEADLLGHAPTARAHLAAGVMTLQQACEAVVVVSDNTAANLLLARMGGPAALTQWLRRIGDTTTRLDRNEPSLNENARGDPRDTTTPAAMRETVRRLLLTDGHLSGTWRRMVWEWMQASRTGMDRIRGGTPVGWAIGDKTGTGNGAVNDVAILYPSSRRPPWVVACYIDAPGAEVAACEDAMRAATRAALFALGHTIAAPPLRPSPP